MCTRRRPRRPGPLRPRRLCPPPHRLTRTSTPSARTRANPGVRVVRAPRPRCCGDGGPRCSRPSSRSSGSAGSWSVRTRRSPTSMRPPCGCRSPVRGSRPRSVTARMPPPSSRPCARRSASTSASKGCSTSTRARPTVPVVPGRRARRRRTTSPPTVRTGPPPRRPPPCRQALVLGPRAASNPERWCLSTRPFPNDTPPVRTAPSLRRSLTNLRDTVARPLLAHDRPVRRPPGTGLPGPERPTRSPTPRTRGILSGAASTPTTARPSCRRRPDPPLSRRRRPPDRPPRAGRARAS
ncbi:hypothetical protein GALL_552190 [mine drainage metagenome]|uniref:Uncharacterized protein n=1 Tax=mine drainage metagenome TaxID=410659 RepID=A0A1J5NYE2_9ZZZZ